MRIGRSLAAKCRRPVRIHFGHCYRQLMAKFLADQRPQRRDDRVPLVAIAAQVVDARVAIIDLLWKWITVDGNDVDEVAIRLEERANKLCHRVATLWIAW